MLRINQVRMDINHTEKQLKDKICALLHITTEDILSYEIMRQSIDARKKPDIYYIYTVDLKIKNEKKVYDAFEAYKNNKKSKRKVNEQLSIITPVKYHFPDRGDNTLSHRPVVIGMGPAGLFCGYYLALHGYRPIILERGKAVEERKADVLRFWETGVLDTASNVQFGEGGAGTFSDGKLNTLVKDKDGRNREVLETFVKFGANESIVYDAKPHIGTDVLYTVVKNMRNEIIRLGGEVFFESQVTDIILKDKTVKGVQINNDKVIDCDVCVLAPGHSARDTFYMLKDHDIPMEAKAFAVGFRVQHPQKMINYSQYGMEDTGKLGAAPYKVAAKTDSGRGVYSFCMCPGGYVVNASSEEGMTAVNGMSYSKRDGENANSAIIVSVGPEDYPDSDALSGIEFQRELERKTYQAGKGNIPVQRFGDFAEKVEGSLNDIEEHNSEECNMGGQYEDSVAPACKGAYTWADLTEIMSDECNRAFVQGMKVFGHQIKGFDRPDAVLCGIESRTSSPVRINRDESMQSEVRGLYPCGEGAGYAGGITSAAMDGIRAAEMIAQEYCAPSPILN